jgi:hypothetical protein
MTTPSPSEGGELFPSFGGARGGKKKTSIFEKFHWYITIISYFGGSFDYDEYWYFCPARDNILVVTNEVD